MWKQHSWYVKQGRVMKVSELHTLNSYSSTLLSWHTVACTQVQLHEYISLISISLDLPAGEKLHDLVALLNFDISKVAGETLGAQSVQRHQEILQEHWSSSDVIYHHFKICIRCITSNPSLLISRPTICWSLLYIWKNHLLISRWTPYNCDCLSQYCLW